MTVAIIALVGPMLNSSTTMMRYENAGTVCMASSTGRSTLSRRGCRAHRIPTGMPIASATDDREQDERQRVEARRTSMPSSADREEPDPRRATAFRQPAR